MTTATPTTTQTEESQTDDQATWQQRLLEALVGKNVRTRGLMIRQNGKLQPVGVIKKDRYHEPGRGLYHAAPGYRLHLTKHLRPGPYVLWPEGDPYAIGAGGKQEVDVDPITGRHSKDDIARLMDTMTGGYLPSVVNRGHKTGETPSWLKGVLITVAILGACAIAYYYAHQKGMI